MTISFAVEALSFRLGSSFGLLHGSGNLLAILLEVPFFPLPFYLKLVVLSTINTWCFSWFLPSPISASRRARESFSSSLAYYSLSWSSSSLVIVTRELYYHYLVWKINSHLIQVIVVPRHSEHMLTGWAILLHLVGKVLSEVFYLSTWAWVWNTNFNS